MLEHSGIGQGRSATLSVVVLAYSGEVDALYTLANPFVGHALRAALVALVWLIAGGCVFAMPARLKVPAWPLLTGAGAWGLFALLEAEATREGADIRVDLLFTWPALCAISIGCAVAWIVLVCRRRAP